MTITKFLELTEQEKEMLGKASDILNELIGKDESNYEYKMFVGEHIISVGNTKEFLQAIEVLESLR